MRSASPVASSPPASFGEKRQEQLVDQAGEQQLAVEVRAALAEQRAHAQALAQLAHRRRQVEQPVASRAHVVDLRRALGQARLRRRDQHHARIGLVEQRRVGRQRQAPGDDARERLLAEPPLDAPPPRVGVGDDPAVALDAHGARAGHHRVDARAQRVEQLAVGAVADRPRAPADACAPVDRADHVEDRVRPSGGPALGALRAGPARRRSRPRRRARRVAAAARTAARARVPMQRRAGRRRGSSLTLAAVAARSRKAPCGR